jgi:TonB family protein
MLAEASSMQSTLALGVAVWLVCSASLFAHGDPSSSAATAQIELEVLNNTQGVDLRSYLQTVEKIIKIKWYNLIPESARPPIMKRGQVVIEFAILKDGKIAGMKLVSGSGDVALDRGAWGVGRHHCFQPVAFSSAPVYWFSSCPARALLLQLQSRFLALGPGTRTSSP